MSKNKPNIIWAPWRMDYIKKGNGKGCVFCRKLKMKDNLENLVLYRGKTCFIMLNLYPYNNGHLMIVPYKHVKNWEKIAEDTLSEMMHLSQKMVVILKKLMNPVGFNLGINIGKAAGAGVAGHVHLHLVPRWNGDSNFMSVIGRTRVIPQSLEQTYKMFKTEILREFDAGK